MDQEVIKWVPQGQKAQLPNPFTCFKYTISLPVCVRELNGFSLLQSGCKDSKKKGLIVMMRKLNSGLKYSGSSKENKLESKNQSCALVCMAGATRPLPKSCPLLFIWAPCKDCHPDLSCSWMYTELKRIGVQ